MADTAEHEPQVSAIGPFPPGGGSIGATTVRPSPTGDTGPGNRDHRPLLPVLQAAAVALAGMSVALVVAWDGSPTWRVIRAVAVLAVTAAAGAAAVRPWSRSTLPGWAGLGAGLVAGAVGTGIGLRSLALGASPLVVTGTVTFAAGIAAVGLSVARLAGARRGWRHVLLPPAVLGLAYLVMWPLSHAVIATNVPPTPLPARSPASLGLRYETVSFPTTDGVSLAAWWVPPTNGAALVLRHGAGSNRADTLDHAAVLARHGYGVLLLDARGHGGSGGRAMDFGWYGDADLDAGVTFLRSRAEVRADRIGAVGLSMGGEEAVGAAGRFRAVVAEGATNRVAADRAWMARQFGLAGRLQTVVDRLTYGLTDLLTDASPPTPLRDAVAAAPDTPVLLVTAGQVEDEALAAQDIRAASPATVTLWDVAGAGHTGGLAARPAEWERTVTDFLDRHLLT
jgi:dienelactone hydrolase